MTDLCKKLAIGAAVVGHGANANEPEAMQPIGGKEHKEVR